MAIQRLQSKQNGLRYRPLVRNFDGSWMKSHTWDRLIDAQKEERELLTARDSGKYRKSMFEALPFKKAGETWLQSLRSRDLSCSYVLRAEQYVVNHLNPVFGKMDIKEIRPSHVASLIAKLRAKKLTADTINSIVKSLKALFSFHAEEENVLTNPVKKKHIIRDNEVQKDEVVWTPEEAGKLLAYADEKYTGDKRWVYLMYKIPLNTGMRQGEILALSWEDIDFKNSRLRVNKSYCSKSRRPKPPKNGKTRYPPLSPSLARDIREYAMQMKRRGPLFKREDGQYESVHTLRNRHWLKDIEALGLRHMKYHNTRRFFIRESIRKGVREAELRKIVGHGSQAMIDLYMNMLEDMKDLAELVNF